MKTMPAVFAAFALWSAAALAAEPVARQPFVMDWSRHGESVIDLSRHLETPAGKAGFIRAEGGHLVKPDGTRFRIWGVNVCSRSCFPEKAEAVALADQLARLGINAVRFHHMDSGWSVLFDKSRNDTRQLDADALDRLDYLIAELKKRGIYSNLNLNVGRHFKPGDGVRDAEQLGYGKSATYFNPRLIELQQEFARQLLTHQNPYTGNEYRHEPAVATVELVNENSVLEGWVGGRLGGKEFEKPDTWSPLPTSYQEELTDQFHEWLKANRPAALVDAIRAEAGVGAGGRVPRLVPAAFRAASAERFAAEAQFYMELEHRFFAGMKRLLKEELGVKPPLVGTADHNDGYAAYGHIEANAMFDWIDGHGYWQHPNYRAEVPSCQNTPMVNDPLDSTVTQFARTPVAGRAFTISEVNHPFPHEYACEGYPILTAYSMFHDWDGIYWFTWDNGRGMSADGGIPSRAFFQIGPDPVKIANLMACGALWHQGGIAAARQTVTRSCSPQEIVEAMRMDKQERPYFKPGFPRTTPLVHATRFRFGGDVESAFPPAAPAGAIVADTGELGWYNADRQQGLVAIDADGAQGLIGYVRAGGRSTTHLIADVRNDFCSLLLVPLDGKSVASSSRLLLAATAWCGNTGMVWDEKRRELPGWGQGPVLIEPVTGTVTLRGMDAGSFTARPLTAAGARMDAVLPARCESGQCAITLGSPPTTLVEIVRESPQ